jgi:adenylate kinase family enzyme
MRIAIVGYSGSGKSTLARALGKLIDAPVLHLDAVNFAPGWAERDTEAALADVEAFLDAHDSWVIDGNSRRYAQERRLREADLIVRVELPRLQCFARVMRRWRRYAHESRPDMAAGCPEKVDWAFARWVLHDGRTRAVRTRRAAALAPYGDKTIRLTSQRAIDAYLRTLDGNPTGA